jgi:AraC-like DNA-binding protein
MMLASLPEFARDPVGRFVCGDRYVHFCAEPKLWGLILWGRPTEADALEIGKSLVFELNEPAVPHGSIIDASRLEGGEPAAFQRAERYLARYGELLSQAVLRLAMVRPSGFGGAIVAGAYAVLPRPYPVSIFEDVGEALAWLAPVTAAGGRSSEIASLMAGAYEHASKTPAIVRMLREYLETHLDNIMLADAAAALSMSERSLQRKLAETGTTFQDEIAGARVRVAQRLLLETETPLTVIALEVGCASLQHFSALFRKCTGESPSAWRRARRA